MAPAQVLLNVTRALGSIAQAASQNQYDSFPSKDHVQVLILGGGMAGVMAARELSRAGVHNFLVVEARNELGGRLMSHTLENGLTIELGANWVEGLHSGE